MRDSMFSLLVCRRLCSVVSAVCRSVAARNGGSERDGAVSEGEGAVKLIRQRLAPS